MADTDSEQIRQDQLDMQELGFRRSALQKYVPRHLREGLSDFITNGRPVGHFLTAVLSNNLFGALSHADDMSGRYIKEICLFLYNDVNMAVGRASKDTHDHWVSIGGHKGWLWLNEAATAYQNEVEDYYRTQLRHPDGLSDEDKDKLDTEVNTLSREYTEASFIKLRRETPEITPAEAARKVFQQRVRSYGQ